MPPSLARRLIFSYVRDDRGRWFPVVRYGFGPLSFPHDCQIPLAGRRAIIASFNALIRHEAAATAAISAVFAGGVILCFAIYGLAGRFEYHVPITLVAASLITLLAVRLLNKILSRLRARAMILNGYCPSCAYRIADVPPDITATTVCPECSAAWRIPSPSSSPSASS